MKTITARQLRRQIGQIKANELPITITRYDEPQYILISAQEYVNLLKIQDYDPKEMQMRIDGYEKYLRSKHINPESLLFEYQESENYTIPEPVKKTDTAKSFVEQARALGMNVSLGK